MGWGGGGVGMPQNIMRALCTVIRPDHFKFASYGPAFWSKFSTTVIGISLDLPHVEMIHTLPSGFWLHSETKEFGA